MTAHPFPAVDHASAREGLAAILDRLVPPDAAVVVREGLWALAWIHDSPMNSRPCTGALVTRDDGVAGFVFPDCPLESEGLVSAIARQRIHNGTLSTILCRQVQADAAGNPDPERQAVLAKLAANTDAASRMLASSLLIRCPGILDFLDSGRPQAPAIHAFARAYPWLVELFSDPEALALASAIEAGGLEGGAVHMLSLWDVAPGPAAKVARRMAGFSRHPDDHFGHISTNVSCAALSMVPEEMFPAPLPEAPTDAELAPYRALHGISPIPAALSVASGRPFASVTGRVRSWDAWLDAVEARCGLAPDGAPNAFRTRARRVECGIDDMVVAFAEEVLAPALAARDGTVPAPVEGQHVLLETVEQPLPRAAARLLLGNGTVPALAETARAWHARSADIARFTSSLVEGDGHVGPRLFEDIAMEDGLYLTCLATPRELLDEGAAGPDATGALGLDHCVGSYWIQVVTGETAVMSLRRRLPDGGYERLSTVEAGFVPDMPWNPAVSKVIQHYGRGDSLRPKAERDMIDAALVRVRDEARQRLVALRESDKVPPRLAMIVHEAGAWEKMRDLWSFALTRPQRAMGAGEILREAGL